MAEQELAKWIYAIAKEQGWIDALRDFLRKKRRVLVLGSSGVGKTALIQSLMGNKPVPIHHADRTVASYKVRIDLAGTPFILTDTPGQEAHRRERAKAIVSSVGALDAIINVVSYGYHEYTLGKDAAINEEGKPDQAFLEKRRQIELEALDEWTEILAPDEKCRLITVISKADLWWDDHKAAFSHYEAGDYFKRLGAARHLSPVVRHYCAFFQRFYGVAPMSGYFDDADLDRAKVHLLRTLAEATGATNEN